MRFTFIAAMLVLPVFAFGQSNQGITEIKDRNVVETLSSIVSLTVKDFGQGVAHIYIADNGSGSAKFPESDESSQSIIISVAEYDEHPEHHVFSISPLINPKLVSSTRKGNTLIVEEGIATARKKHTVTLYENRIAYN